MEERQRVKIVDYVGSKQVETSKIDEKLKDAERPDPPRHLHRSRPGPQGRGHRARHAEEKGFQFANVTHDIKEIPGGPKLVHITFNMDEGPKVKIRKIEFVGNKAISDSALKRQMKENTSRGLHRLHPLADGSSLIGDSGTYQEQKFDDDAEKVVAYYRDHGYICARNVGVPELKVVGDSDDKKTRWIELRIPITEGPRYKVGELRVRRQHHRQDRVPEAAVQDEPGRVLRREAHPQGAGEGARSLRHRRLLGFTGFPDYKFHDDPNPDEPRRPRRWRAPERRSRRTPRRSST